MEERTKSTPLAVLPQEKLRQAGFVIDPLVWRRVPGVACIACITTRMRQFGIAPTVRLIPEGEDGAAQACLLLAQGVELMMVVGQDATVRAVAAVLAGTSMPLGIIPLDAEDRIARSLGIPASLDAACAVIARGRLRRLPVARIQGQLVFGAIHIGYGALLAVASAQFRRHGVTAAWRSLLPLMNMAWARPRVFGLQLDGQSQVVWAKGIIVVPVLEPDVRPKENQAAIEVTIVARNQGRAAMQHSGHGRGKPPHARPAQRTLRARQVCIMADAPVPIVGDDSALGMLASAMMVVPEQLLVFAPAGDTDPPLPLRGTVPAHLVNQQVSVVATGDQLMATTVELAALQPGDILLFEPDGTLGGKVIDFLTRSAYHHIGIYAGDGMVIEAMPGGVLHSPIAQRRVIGIHPCVAAIQQEAVVAWAKQHLGDQYDMPALGMIAVHRLLPGLGVRLSARHRFTCAVFVADAYLHAGVDLVPGRQWQDLIPGDFTRLLHPQMEFDPIPPHVEVSGEVTAR